METTPTTCCGQCGRELHGTAVCLCWTGMRLPIQDHDPVNHPRHYTSHPSGVECIQITEHLSFCVGNAIKYLWRADLKNGTEDLEKAAWYIAREIDRRKKAAP